MKLKKLIKESWLEEKKTLTKEEKKMFLEKVKKFNNFKNRIFRQEKVTDVAKELFEIARMAEVLTLSEVDENFDKITVERNVKEMKRVANEFQKSAGESHILEQRMKEAYDNLGHLLERYYEVDDVDENSPGQDPRDGHGLGVYDDWKSNDTGEQKQSVLEDLPDQHVEKGQGKKPYDNRIANDFGGQPKEPKQSIEERKKKSK